MRSGLGPGTRNENGTDTSIDEPAANVSGSVTWTVVSSGRSTASATPSTRVTPGTSSRTPAAASTGELGQRRNTSSFVGRSGVNRTVIPPSTVPLATSTSAVAKYDGRFGSGSASGPGSGQPAIGANGLAVGGGAGIVTTLVVVTDALDDADDALGLASSEHATSNNAQAAINARRRIGRWWHGYPRAVPSRIATCVWRTTPALIVALDERFGEPTDAYVNGSQTWLRDDGPTGTTLEWRFHPRGGGVRPPGLDTHQGVSAGALPPRPRRASP